MVDLFVNYDCDMQAANLFERSVNGLSKLLQRSPPSSLFATQQAQKARDVALDAVLSILKSLDTWAEPLKVSYYCGAVYAVLSNLDYWTLAGAVKAQY